jgi:hypothetical protein
LAAELFSSVQNAGFICEEVLRATLEGYLVPELSRQMESRFDAFAMSLFGKLAIVISDEMVGSA